MIFDRPILGSLFQTNMNYQMTTKHILLPFKGSLVYCFENDPEISIKKKKQTNEWAFAKVSVAALS